MAFVMKAIRPGKLKVDAIKNEMFQVLLQEGREHVKEYTKTVATWKHEVHFDFLIDDSGGNLSVLSGPASGAVEIWNWLDKGTKPHIIAARRAKRLKFRLGYVARTRPGYFGSDYSPDATGEWRSPVAVMHPGTEARGWTELLAQHRKEPFRRAVIAGLQRATKELWDSSGESA